MSRFDARTRHSIHIAFMLLACGSASSMGAELAVSRLFSDGAVLQRDIAIPVWGTAAANAQVVVVFAGQARTTTATEEGAWRVNLDPTAASGQPRRMSISSDAQSLAINDLLVGDVWLCAGQSNMAMRVDLGRDAEIEKANSDLPQLRVFTVDYQPAREPLAEVSGEWIAASPGATGRFSACAFFFGRELHRELKIPIGLIVAARGGSDIAAWTSRAVQENEPSLKGLLSAWAERDAAYTPEIEKAQREAYDLALADWKSKIANRSVASSRPKKPRSVVNPRDHWHHPAVLYNGMIAPIIPYAIRGGIWYQGETNALTEESSTLYEKQLPLIVDDWRSRWGQGDFPFAWVQLPFTSAKQFAWARIRESMRLATSLRNTGMIVTLDLGEERLLHPKNKQAFAHRLALWARANVYREDIEYSGPMVSGHRVGEQGVLIRFAHAEGLVAKDEPLKGFEFLDADRKWKPANARIRNDRVVLSISTNPRPAAIRYAWANHPDGNLFNAAGLPASPFMLEVSSPTISAYPDTNKTQPKARKPVPADLFGPPLDAADLSEFPDETLRLDIYLLMGQSNMKGRGVMPVIPVRDPRIVMMHRRTDEYFLARHPLHLVGKPKDFSGADNAGVGPGLAFAQAMLHSRPESRILLVPCAVGGTAISKWAKGQRLYDDTIRRAKLAAQQGPAGATHIAGALWLQGESDSTSPEQIASYQQKLLSLIDNLRSDIDAPKLPFVACTIGEKRDDVVARRKINDILLSLPKLRRYTECVDGRNDAEFIGDNVHFDTATQNEHGRRFAKLFLDLENVEE